MSILSQLVHKQITFQQAEQQAETWAKNLIAHDPTVTAVTGEVLSGVKQAASNAIDAADKALGAFIGPLTETTEQGLEAALAGVTKGASTPFNPFISDGIDRFAQFVKDSADAWALKKKAELAGPAPAPGQGG